MKILLILIVLSLAGCATYSATLTNDKGQSVKCEVSGANGLITGRYLKQEFNNCVQAAQAHGYKE